MQAMQDKVKQQLKCIHKATNPRHIKRTAEDVSKTTGMLLSAFSVIGLVWMIGHKKK